MIRLLGAADASEACALYRVLMPDVADTAQFETILSHPGTFVAGANDGGRIVAMATLHLLPNMTQGGRPYGLIENVVAQDAYRGAGHARAVMEFLHDIAWTAQAYKIMLMTGRDTGARGFYENLGYSANQKHGMQIRQVPPRKP